MFFQNSQYGNNEMQKSAAVYNDHPELILLAREQRSYKGMIEAFEDTRVELVPDIVFFLENKLQLSPVKRSGILVVLRKDKESYFSQQDKDILIEYLKENYKVTTTDTTNGGAFSNGDRERRLYEFWGKFSAA